MTDDPEEEAPTVTTQLVTALDVVLFEITRMENAVRDAPAESVSDSDRRALRVAIDAIWNPADSLMTWLAEQRLEAPKN